MIDADLFKILLANIQFFLFLEMIFFIRLICDIERNGIRKENSGLMSNDRFLQGCIYYFSWEFTSPLKTALCSANVKLFNFAPMFF